MYDLSRGYRQKIHVTAIDPLKGYYEKSKFDPTTRVPVTSAIFEHNMRRMDIPRGDVTLIRALSTDKRALQRARKRRYELLIIDGDHSYEGVKFDVEHYCSLVERGGYIIVDDYGAAEWPDIKSYVDKELRTSPDLVMVGTDWRTAVFRVTSVAER